MNVTANISLITNSNGYLCKEWFVEDDQLSKVSHGDLWNGTIETVELSLAGLKTTIEGLTPKQALCIGTRKPEYSNLSNLTTAKKVVTDETIARSKDYIEFSTNAAFMLLDYDDKDLSPPELHTKLLELVPEFAEVGMLFVPSSSAGVHLASDTPPEVIKSGCHIYIMVENGTDIPKIGELIKNRAWLAGLGYIKVSKSGGLLIRHIFDDAVYSPERLIFDALPLLNAGVMQVPRELLLIEGGAVKGLNFEQLLTVSDLNKQRVLISNAKANIKPQADRTARSYDKAELNKLVASGEKQDKAKQIISKRRGGTLVGTTTLKSRSYGVITVDDVLSDPEKYKNDSLIDPEETDTGTNYRAKVMYCANSTDDPTPVLKIRSFAHGETFYRLEATHKPPVDLVPLDQAIPDFTEFAPHTRPAGKNEVVLMPTLENLKALATYYGISFEYDVIRREKIIKFAGERKKTDLSNDADLHKLRNLCVVNLLPPCVTDGINEIFAENEVNKVTDFIKATKWDGVSRIETIFQTLTLANQTDYDYGLSVFKHWLIQCVAAADSAQSTPLPQARAKYEMVFILASSQGGHKTDWFECLTPQELRMYHSKGVQLALDDKDSVFEATSFWIVELGELDATFRKSDISALKAFLSRSYELIRRPYDKVANTYKRRTSFCGTVNDSKFLHDITGNRRYLPLEITKCEKNHNVDMAQVWAEVWGLYVGGEKWWFDSDDSMAGEILKRQQNAMNYDPVIEELIVWNGGDCVPCEALSIVAKKYTVKELIEEIRKPEVQSVYTAKSAKPVTTKEQAAVRAYLIGRGFKYKKTMGVYKFTILRNSEKIASNIISKCAEKAEYEAWLNSSIDNADLGVWEDNRT
jgi:hypothetical protein